MIDYDNIYLKRSRRKTVAMEILPDGKVLVRAPYLMPADEIKDFVHKNEGWLEKHLAKLEKTKEEADAAGDRLSMEELKELAGRAVKVIPERVSYYAEKLGVTYGRITIRNQKSRWGSCSSRGNLNFNVLLMLTPPEVMDSVVVHELCHRKEMNHSQKFWREVEKYCPTYKEDRAVLRRVGRGLLERV